MDKILEKEYDTVNAMIRLYCIKNHHIKELCISCSELSEYCREQLEKCPYKEKKPTCGRCKIHCYKEDKRLQIKKVMKFSGPRLIFYRPDLFINYVIKKLRV